MKIQQKESPPQLYCKHIVVLVIAICFAVGGVIGLIVSATLSNDFAAPSMPPRFLTIWLSLFMTFYSLQILWNLLVFPFHGFKNSLVNLIHYIVISLVVFVLMVSNYVGYRNDGGTWGLFLLVPTILNAAIYWERLKEIKGKSEHEKHGILGNITPQSGVNIESLKPAMRRLLYFIAALNIFFLGLAFILIILLIGGSTIQANGYRSFPPRGIFVNVISPNGLSSKVMVYCSGNRNTSRPTFLFDIGGGGHSR
jgi:hypothetical protein